MIFDVQYVATVWYLCSVHSYSVMFSI